MYKAEDFFVLSDEFPFKESFPMHLGPWEWVSLIKDCLSDYAFEPMDRTIPAGLLIKGAVYIHPSVELPAFGHIEGPCYIGEQTVLRPGVYIRGQVIVGASCVLGNSCEFKNSLILDGAQIPHFSYVGDSIIGNKAHLGAGVICSNLRLDQKPVKIYNEGRDSFDTQMRKLGAIIGDEVEVGCHAVLNPGSLLLPKSAVHPGVMFKGTLGPASVAFNGIPVKQVRASD